MTLLNEGRHLARMLSRIVITAKRRGDDPRVPTSTSQLPATQRWRRRSTRRRCHSEHGDTLEPIANSDGDMARGIAAEMTDDPIAEDAPGETSDH